ncbi:hypothetical protein LTS18_003950 [Coniosporium uncinatum]|uniref:Uncharacterized protein n=1 Tax=Coniosporium uncinatum TaxID=93489 RepID=A0ACC3D676_9PEZI|nr:hypothetical protein LTS18_003950 [Coniosporium uncinatum]
MTSLALRSVQIIFAAIVLGLSVSLAKGQGYGSVPATTGYSSFVGGFGIIVAAVGFAAIFIEKLNGIVIWVVDGLAAMFYLAGGIAIAVQLRGVSCSNNSTTSNNALLNGGCFGGKEARDRCDSETCCTYGYDRESKTFSPELKSRCQMDEADAAFMFMGFLITLGLIVVSFLVRRKSGGRKVVGV